MSESVSAALQKIRDEMAEKFGKKTCTIECTVDEAIAMKLVVEESIMNPTDEFLSKILEFVPMRIKNGLDKVKP